MSNFVLEDCFFAPRIERNMQSTVPAVWAACEKTGRFKAFDLNWKEGDPGKPHIYWDSDVAKLLEGMCRMYALNGDKKLLSEIDSLVDRIVASQQSDGYLNSYFTQIEPDKRFTNLFDAHELYCAGHLMECAVEHFRATGSRKMLDCMCRYADYLYKVFGPGGERRGCPGHEEIELALCSLYDASGEKRYLDLAEHFLNIRGVEPNSFAEEREVNYQSLRNRQAHKPVREQFTAEGHAVRMLYLARGMAEVAARTGDTTLLDACEAIAQNIAGNRMYITGAVGSSSFGEAFTADGDLPDTSAYAESCASIALALFAETMLKITGKVFYAELLERVLYNGAISGLSLPGDRFFYANLLVSSAATNEHGWVFRERKEWFGCSCCPTSYTRFLPQIGRMCVQDTSDALQITVPAAGVFYDDNNDKVLEISGQYPFDGNIKIKVVRNMERALKFRVMKHCCNCRITRNGEPVVCENNGNFAILAEKLTAGDVFEITFELITELVYPNSRLVANRGMAAIQRGAVVYCLESCDNPDWSVGKGAFSISMNAAEVSGDELLAGVKKVVVDGSLLTDGSEELYSTVQPQWHPARFTLIPYAFWQNRGLGEMTVFMPVR